MGSFAAEPRLLHAAERHMLGRDDADIDADHAVLERFGNAEDAADVAAVEIARKAELSVVRRLDRFLFILELEDRCERTESFLPRAQHLAARTGNYCGFEELALQFI